MGATVGPDDERPVPHTDLELAIAEVLDGLEPGDVVTYGEVALEAGYPGRSRAVGRFCAVYGGDYPWWRVVNSVGRLVPGHEERQARLLKREGVATRDGHVPGMRSGRRAGG